MPLRTDTQVHVLGVRHHGPGSARAVARVLAAQRPDAIVIEGPPELDALLPLAGSPDLVPPVAALVYAPDEPRRASFYPMAAFSPEWVALRWGLANSADVRFADLPAVHALAPGRPDADPPPPVDAIGLLANAAGYDEPERWWEDAVEHRFGSDDPLAPFTAVLKAMREVRAGTIDDPHNLRREAAMRRVIRAVVKTGPARLVVVCGAWHAPSLTPDAFPTIATDAARLRKLPRRKVAVTWAPWTARRLTQASGYGAGVAAPGWYAHAFAVADDRMVEEWMVTVARALRRAGSDAPSAMVIDAARLARSLATLRGRPVPGLAECTDAIRATLLNGSDVPLSLIHTEVVIGSAIGRVPDEAPMIPLAADLRAQQRRARLRPAAEPKTVTVDLRRPSGLAKSTLLHRLRLLDIPWGTEVDVGGTTGTFKEAWSVVWEPELEVAVIEAGVWGTTVEAAAEARAAELAQEAADLSTLTGVLRRTMPAALQQATAAIVAEVERRSAGRHDALTLMRATEPLADAARYGTVRNLPTGGLVQVLRALVLRAAASLEPACRGLDDDAAERVRAAIDATHRAVSLATAIEAEEADQRDRPRTQDLGARWLEALRRVARTADREPHAVHGLLAGRLDRVLSDAGRIDDDERRGRLSRRLSSAADARGAAAYLDGFLDGDATLLLLDGELLGVIDAWVRDAEPQTFDDVLPLLRRTFARYPPAQRRALGTALRRPRGAAARTASGATIDPADLADTIDVVLEMLR